MPIFWKCYVKPGKADIVQIPFKEKQAEEAANCTKCIDLSPKATEVRSHFLLLPFYCALSTLGYLSNWQDIPLIWAVAHVQGKLHTFGGKKICLGSSLSYRLSIPSQQLYHKGTFCHGALVIVNLQAFFYICSAQISEESLLASMIIPNSTMYIDWFYCSSVTILLMIISFHCSLFVYFRRKSTWNQKWLLRFLHSRLVPQSNC